METKTPGLTKLILIVESVFLVAALAVFFILKNIQEMPNLTWLWGAIMVFSAASFLFLFVIFIITLAKKSLRTTFFLPLLFIGFIVFLVVSLIMFAGPSIMQPVVIDFSDQEIISENTIVEESEPLQTEEKAESQQGETEKSSEPEEIKVYNIGDLVEIGDVTIIVNGVRTTEKDEWNDQVEEGYIYLLVDLSIENKGNNDAYIDTFMNFRLVDKDGRNYKSVYAEKARGNVDGTLNSGRKIAGELGYAIPEDVYEFEIEIKDPDQQQMAMSGDIVLISIALE
jgi:hypothetical protein